MTSPKNPHPIESFDPKLVAALSKGSREEVTVKFPTKRLAHRFQTRLNMLRRRALNLGRPEHKIFARCRVSLRFGEAIGKEGEGYKKSDWNQPAWVVLAPQDVEFASALEAAGITESDGLKLEPETSEFEEAPQPLSPAEAAGFESLLNELGKK